VVSGFLLAALPPDAVPVPPSPVADVPVPGPVAVPFSLRHFSPFDDERAAPARCLRAAEFLFGLFAGALEAGEVVDLFGKPSTLVFLGGYDHQRYPRQGVELVFQENGLLRD